jgi:hypothetical protein
MVSAEAGLVGTAHSGLLAGLMPFEQLYALSPLTFRAYGRRIRKIQCLRGPTVQISRQRGIAAHLFCQRRILHRQARCATGLQARRQDHSHWRRLAVDWFLREAV